MSQTSSNRQVLITGITKGLGQALAIEFLSCGYSVTGIGRTPEANISCFNGLPVTPLYHCCDLSSQGQLLKTLAHLDECEFSPDLIILNAGYAESDIGTGIDTKNIENQFSVNFFSGLIIMEHYLPIMIKKNQGHLAVVLSLAAFRENNPERLGYSASKIAMAKIFENLRLKYARTNIKFTAFFPGRMGGTNRYGMGISYKAAARKIVKEMTMKKNKSRNICFPCIQAICTKVLHHCPDNVFRCFFYK